MEVFELFINDEETDGVYAYSLVGSPAIESNFIALSKQEVVLKEVNKEKRIVMGALLIPNKQILRFSEKLGEYKIFFSPETVEKASQLFLTKGFQSNSTLEHTIEVGGISVVESWIIADEEKDKSRVYGLSNPVGTWMISLKINNDDIWNDFVKSGRVKGFSLEGIFDNEEKLSEQSEKEILIQKIKDLLK